MTIENRRYCPNCDDNTMILRMGQFGQFYSCLNRNNPQIKCTFTQPASEQPHYREGVPEPAVTEPFIPPRTIPQPSQIKMEQGAAEIEAAAKAHFGDEWVMKYEDMPDERRLARADYFMALMPKSIFRPLPYNPANRSDR